jgi:hypothetical protein
MQYNTLAGYPFLSSKQIRLYILLLSSAVVNYGSLKTSPAIRSCSRCSSGIVDRTTLIRRDAWVVW